MDVDGPGAIPSPGTEEETIARKRSRRVSFADTTAVHVFDRDEDFRTPPEERSASQSPSPRRSSAEAEDGDDMSDAGSPAPPIIFLPDIDSSSPGSAAGSVVSVDDENFFGPVSTSFIQTGRPSDAGMSEDGNHDITLDSRTFSRHFLNVAPPEECTANSVGSLRTPDTASKGPLTELNASEPGRKSSSGRDALTDMSMLTGNPRTYDYGRLSPMLKDVMQKLEQDQQRNSPVPGISDLNPVQASVEECREDNSCLVNGISFNQLGAFSITEDNISIKNAVYTSSDPIQEDNVMITDGFEKYQENCYDDQVSVNPGISKNNKEPHAKLPPQYNSDMTSASEASVSLKVFREKHSEDNDSVKSANVDWNKVVCTISNAMERVLAASISKLNLQQLNALSDKLDDFQMARKYRRLSNAVRVEDCYGDQQKRLAEARSLHERLLYERAKLSISNMKLARLRSKSQRCQIGIQECSFLKDKIVNTAQKNNASLYDKSLIHSGDSQEWLTALSERRLEYTTIQQNLESLSSLEYFRNNEVDISCQSVMRSAEEHLDMRNQCRIIQQQAGLPKLMDIVKRDNKRDIILNYRNLLFQRIILNISNVSSIFVNSLNRTRIGQAFPNLDASVAFHYIFKAEENQSVSDLQLLQKKTMETSLLLGNLVGVLDEIKFAKMKLLNLTSAAFVLESETCQLALRVCFMSFKSGKSIGFTIDMTDLNRSVYPSEPSELLIKLCREQTTLSQPSIEEIMVSIRNLQSGRTVILRLCRMVSQQIQSLPC